jgi:hypothetical protein
MPGIPGGFNNIKYINLCSHIEGVMPDGTVFYIDTENLEFVKSNYWHLHDGYLRSTKHGMMHRKILNVPKNMECDHINRNRLDNRKSNLRVVTHKENMQNKSTYKNNSSGYPGIKWNKSLNKWQSQITINKVRKHLGVFANLQDAVIARRLAEQTLS